MLSRIAESLYWVGRDIERAEGTARILDVHFHLLLEQPAELNRPSCEALLGVMGMRDRAQGRTANAELVNELLAYDRGYPGSIVGALGAARRSASGAREVIPAEMWEAINATYNQLPVQADSAGFVPHSFFRWVKERAAMISGLAIPGARSQPRTRRHHRPAPDRSHGRRARADGLGHHTEVLLSPRGLSADVPTRRRRVACRRVPPPRPVVSALDVLGAHDGRGLSR
jgi:hypothetical protein